MLAYVNGQFVDDADAVVSARDRGFMLGDGVFDTWRTYGGRLVRPVVEKHLARFRRSVNFLELEGEKIVAEFDDVTKDLRERNADAIAEAGDILMFCVVTRGQTKKAIEGFDPGTPTRVVLCNPIPFAAYGGGSLYEDGVHLVPSMQTQNPFGGYDPRVKALSRLAYVRAERKQARSESGTWVALFDNHGFITEAAGACLAIVEGETVVHPPRWQTLPSVSLNVFRELADSLGFGVEERPLAMYDFLNADESYVLSTSIAMLPIADVDGIAVKRGDAVGPRILEAWKEYVGFDFVAQASELALATSA
jgi:branched-subunit amino acid aminotransferase/4-amino-4-deoxychorismate lyase